MRKSNISMINYIIQKTNSIELGRVIVSEIKGLQQKGMDVLNISLSTTGEYFKVNIVADLTIIQFILDISNGNIRVNKLSKYANPNTLKLWNEAMSKMFLSDHLFECDHCKNTIQYCLDISTAKEDFLDVKDYGLCDELVIN